MGDDLRAWNDGSVRFFLLEGNCFVQQGELRLWGRQAIAWVDESLPADQPTTVGLLVRGSVKVESPGTPSRQFERHHTTLMTTAKLRVEPTRQRNEPAPNHPLFVEASALLSGKPVDADIQQVQFVTNGPAEPRPLPVGPPVPEPSAPPSAPASVLLPNLGAATRQISVSPRGTQPVQFSSRRTADGQQISVFTGGIVLRVVELETGQTADIAADRVVLWTQGLLANLQAGSAQALSEQPIEVYLEGNVVIQQGKPNAQLQGGLAKMNGKQVYYNINTKKALILDGAVETYSEAFQAPLYVQADEIRQLDPDHFTANQASVTTSPYRGTPGYAFTANRVDVEVVRDRVVNPFSGTQILNPETNEPLERTRYFATGYSNFLRVQDVPVFYWPYVRANVEDPLGPIEDFEIGNSDILGFSTSLTLDMWQLLGLDYLPIADRSEWLADIGYFSKRGIAGGTRGNYFGDDFFGISGQHYGNFMLWGIYDEGQDYLGIGRQGITPPREGRGRYLFQHWQELPNDFTLITELSYLSDQNLLESFYEAEYDAGKDQETLIYLKQARNQWGWTFLAQPQINSFLPQNAWLPRGDFYLLGVPLLDNRLTYFTHTSVGYSQLRPPSQLLLPGELDVNTGRVDTRHEINFPLSLGAWQVTPFAIGEFTGYSETATSDELGRLYGAAGVRTSLPFWRVYPAVQSSLFNVSGIAHKVSLNADYLLSAASEDFQRLPYLDQLDDDTSELVRRQNLLRQFGTMPLRYDPRFYALRRNVTSYPEVLDDMQNIRLSVNQRLQTKRGPIIKQRIIDWMVLDIGATIFPDDTRDNFGELFGLIDSSFEWHIGDRTAFLSNMLYEPLDDALVANGAIYFERPPRSNFALFYSHHHSGPFASNYVGTAASYRMSHRYSSYVSVAHDFETTGDVSYQLGLTRIGLDFVGSLGVVYNAGRDDFGLRFELYPRVQARTRLGRANLPTLPFGVNMSESVIPVGEDPFDDTGGVSTN